MAKREFFDRHGKRGAKLGKIDGRRTLRTARHEAGHAVVGTALGCRVKRVELIGADRGYTYWDQRTRNTKLSWAIESLAGTAADWHWRALKRWLVSSGDAASIRRRGYYGRDWAHLDLLATAYVRKYAKLIDRVARELVKRDLTGAEVRKLLCKALRIR